MALSHVSKVFAVKDAKISKLTADASGAAPTYGAAIDVPGIKSVTIGGEVKTAELRGDNTRLDFDAILSGISLTFGYAKMSLDALGVFLGSTVTDAGVTPNQTATLSVKPTDRFSYFKFQAVAAGADTIGGDVLITIHKAILTAFPEMGMVEEDYRLFEVAGAAVPILGTGNAWMDVAIRETSAALV